MIAASVATAGIAPALARSARSATRTAAETVEQFEALQSSAGT